MHKIFFLLTFCLSAFFHSLKAQVIGRLMEQVEVEVFSDFGLVYSTDTYGKTSDYASVGFRLITNDVYGIHLATGLRYQTTVMKYGHDPKANAYDLPYVSQHKNVFLPIYMGYVSERYNYNYYYFRIGFEPYFNVEDGKLWRYDTDIPFVWGYELGTKYDFMNHWMVTAQLQHRVIPTVMNGKDRNDHLFGVHLGLVYKLTI